MLRTTRSVEEPVRTTHDRMPVRTRDGPGSQEEPNAEDPYHHAGDRRRSHEPARGQRLSAPRAPPHRARRRLVGPQDRCGHRRRDAGRQELQRVLLEGRLGRRDAHRRRDAAGDRAQRRVRIRAEHPDVRGPEVRHHRDAGLHLASDTAQAAHDNPDIKFIGVDQSPICVDEQGNADSNFACKGDAATLLPNYIASSSQEDQPGYLAGIVAASMTKIGQDRRHRWHERLCAVVRYIQGYEMGAKSVNPDIAVNIAYVLSDLTPRPSTTRPPASSSPTSSWPVPGHRRHVPGRGQDRQWCAAGRLRRQPAGHRRRRRPVPVPDRPPIRRTPAS